MTFGDYQFTCAICRRDVFDIKRNGRDRHIAPLCRSCEAVVTYAWHGGKRQSGRVGHGAFMDRRKIRQIHALADALHTEAAQQKWSDRYVRT